MPSSTGKVGHDRGAPRDSGFDCASIAAMVPETAGELVAAASAKARGTAHLRAEGASARPP